MVKRKSKCGAKTRNGGGCKRVGNCHLHKSLRGGRNAAPPTDVYHGVINRDIANSIFNGVNELYNGRIENMRRNCVGQIIGMRFSIGVNVDGVTLISRSLRACISLRRGVTTTQVNRVIEGVLRAT